MQSEIRISRVKSLLLVIVLCAEGCRTPPRPPLPVPERQDVPPQVRATIEQLYEKYQRQADVSSPRSYVCATNLSYLSDLINALTPGSGSKPTKISEFDYNWHVNFYASSTFVMGISHSKGFLTCQRQSRAWQFDTRWNGS